MARRAWLQLAVVGIAASAWSCGTAAKMMGMGDLMGAMNNMDRVMAMQPEQMREHVSAKQAAAIARGKLLFETPGTGGGRGAACSSCHPAGGGSAHKPSVQGQEYPLASPTLVGAAGRFPRYVAGRGGMTTLQQMNNYCIEVFAEGKGLPLASPDAWALEAYVASLSNGKPVAVGAGASE